jgi:beta-glucosidase
LQFYGCNFYTTNTIKAGADDETNGNAFLLFTRPDGSALGPESDLDWLRDIPWGFRKHLNYLYKRYGKPIYVTENGYAAKGESQMAGEDAIRE